MHQPATIPGVNKVGAVKNDGAGLTLSPFSNRVQPAYWGGEYIFFAPGGADYSNGIRSALAYTTGKNGSHVIPGTSQATPYVSGLYAHFVIHKSVAAMK
jgi:subtilisin family serine protease